MKKRYLLLVLWILVTAVLLAANDIESSRQNAITQAVELVSPAVVSLNVIKTEVVQSSRFGFSDPFFDQFFPSPRYARKVESSGSGMIISEDGYIVTNEHVVQNAQEIKVTLPDGREFMGKVIGIAETTDIAVVKIKGNNFPYVRFGDSDDFLCFPAVIARRELGVVGPVGDPESMLGLPVPFNLLITDQIQECPLLDRAAADCMNRQPDLVGNIGEQERETDRVYGTVIGVLLCREGVRVAGEELDATILSGAVSKGVFCRIPGQVGSPDGQGIHTVLLGRICAERNARQVSFGGDGGKAGGVQRCAVEQDLDP